MPLALRHRAAGRAHGRTPRAPRLGIDGWTGLVLRDEGLGGIALELAVLVTFGAVFTTAGALVLRRRLSSPSV
ncbi:hypothetical protein BH18ACT1_BH18ACT1_09160 [soil metagenome]